jgi:hypothetical protein
MAKTSTSFKKGDKRAGRPKGTPNKLTKTVRDTVLAAFNDLQSDPKANILTWAKENPKEFYQIAAKLIPTEITVPEGEVLIAQLIIKPASDGNEGK